MHILNKDLLRFFTMNMTKRDGGEIRDKKNNDVGGRNMNKKIPLKLYCNVDSRRLCANLNFVKEINFLFSFSFHSSSHA